VRPASVARGLYAGSGAFDRTAVAEMCAYAEEIEH
jgi:hypothetical protein